MTELVPGGSVRFSFGGAGRTIATVVAVSMAALIPQAHAYGQSCMTIGNSIGEPGNFTVTVPGDFTQNVSIPDGTSQPFNLSNLTVGSNYQVILQADGGFSTFFIALNSDFVFTDGTNEVNGYTVSFFGPVTYSFKRIASTNCQGLTITTTSLPQVVSGTAYSQQLSATGGVPPYTWSVSQGSLPQGFTLDSSSGILSAAAGNSALANIYPLTIQASDALQNTALKTLTLAVAFTCAGEVRSTFGYSGLPASFGPPQAYMAAQFIPPNSQTVAAFAAACGFQYLNWQQTMTNLPSVITPANLDPLLAPPAPRDPSLVPHNVATLDPAVPSNTCSNLPAVPSGSPPYTPPVGWTDFDCVLFANASTPPLYDPPPGDYTYTPETSPSFNSYPFYYPLTGGSCTSIHPSKCPPLPPILSTDGKTLTFIDAPANGESQISPLSFITSLVGVSLDPTKGTLCGAGMPYYCTTLFQWKWLSTFNGTAGGVSQLGLIYPIDPGSGTGGVTITNINGVQLPSSVSSNDIVVTASGLAYSRVTKTFNGTLILKNISSNAINGPLQILLTGVPTEVTMVNATNNLSGTPYLTIPDMPSLAPGQSVTVDVRFSNPSSATINFTPAIYSGSIN